MLFNSFEFFLFFPIVTALYFMLKHKYRWSMLLVASCAFYMAFVPKYILILALTIVVDYFAGILIENAEGKRRRSFLIVSIIVNCLILGVFKYQNFMITNINDIASFLHWNYSIETLKIILPIGLSFHTFQSLSYVIEVYRGHQKAERHFGIYALYVMFYPQLVAGPIERPQNMLHQFHEEHRFDYDNAVTGLRMMVWGLFKKVVIADRMALFVNSVYGDVHSYTGAPLVIATVCFAIQIYCDFSGYSSVAIGAARVMGFRLMTNFERPYFSKSISEFWKRWHISLSTWFKDYVYISLGGNRVKTRSRLYFNLFVTFLISGLWHGANMTYVIWGGLNGIYLVASIVTSDARQRIADFVGITRLPAFHNAFKIAATFALTCLGWVFFRASSLGDAAYVFTHMLAPSSGFGITSYETFGKALELGGALQKIGFDTYGIAIGAVGILIVFLEHALQTKESFLDVFARAPKALRWTGYYAAVISILLFGVYENLQFIYFQF